MTGRRTDSELFAQVTNAHSPGVSHLNTPPLTLLPQGTNFEWSPKAGLSSLEKKAWDYFPFWATVKV